MPGNFEASPTKAALGALFVLQILMLTAMFTQTPPHPPEKVTLFAMGPFLAASLSVVIAAIILGDEKSRSGTVLSLLAASLALISYGPQKWGDPAIGQIWPAILVAQVAILTIILQFIKRLFYLQSHRVKP